MITGKQVNLLLALFTENGIFGGQRRIDWLYEREIDVPQMRDRSPNYEAMSRDEFQRALKALGHDGN